MQEHHKDVKDWNLDLDMLDKILETGVSTPNKVVELYEGLKKLYGFFENSSGYWHNFSHKPTFFT